MTDRMDEREFRALVREALAAELREVSVPDPAEEWPQVAGRLFRLALEPAPARRRTPGWHPTAWAGAAAAVALSLLAGWYAGLSWPGPRRVDLAGVAGPAVLQEAEPAPEAAAAQPAEGPRDPAATVADPGTGAAPATGLAGGADDLDATATETAEAPAGPATESAVITNGQRGLRTAGVAGQAVPYRFVSLSEAARRAPFPLLAPTYLPPDTLLVRVEVWDAEPFRVVQHYGGPLGRRMTVEAREVGEAGVTASDSFQLESSAPRVVQVSGAEASLVELADGGVFLTWQAGSVLVRLRSDWDAAETLRVAESLVPLETAPR